MRDQRDQQRADPALVLIVIVLTVLVTVTYVGDRSSHPNRYQDSRSMMAHSNPVPGG
ncbi:MAG TPA: hypothetical protein VHD59_03100 [Pseudolabrys sp.]|jgi:hypothetical protein|nr:hypothetical protein [Pseudolabrys sp.]